MSRTEAVENCLRCAMARKRRIQSNVFDKPNEQNGSTCNALTLCHGEKTKNEVQRFCLTYDIGLNFKISSPQHRDKIPEDWDVRQGDEKRNSI